MPTFFEPLLYQPMPQSNETILILDSGTKNTQLIARRCRDCGVYSHIVPRHISAEHVAKLAPKGIVRIGEHDAPALEVIGIPVLHVPGDFHQAALDHFLKNTCGCRGDWSMKTYAQESIEKFRNIIGDSQVICALSGGVDSAVVAAILAKAVGKQTKCILVDTGLMRKNEIANVVAAFDGKFDVEFKMIDASDGFLKRLAGVEEPQEKRKIIGHYFIDVFAEAAKEFGNAKFLAQGTIYPDIIESGTTLDVVGSGGAEKQAASIKLHHNVGGLPEKLGFELVEPLRELFKDEVRQLGMELGLPEDFVWRHPFPGPGLAVRCLGEVNREKLAKLREADAIVVEEIRNANFYRQTAQAFAALLPVKSVGVKDDKRTYDDAIAVRCVSTDDFMTADWTTLPDELLRKISSRILKEVAGVNRVVYDISSKPPATIEWE